jgi:SpoVK/Ycf46/Vps4 family AAA+-type ATPase
MSEVEIAPKQYNYDALNAVHWNETTTVLKRDLEFFITGKNFFDSRGMAYSRSYLLHGPPGNGKTTTIKAISKFLNAKVETFDFSAARNSPDTEFQNWVLGESERIAREEDAYDDEFYQHKDSNDDDDKTKLPIRFIVFEDIDRLFPKNGLKQTSVSLQAVLQALDGAIERRNMIVVATANHPKELDQQVLARPGRFDKQVFYEQPTVEQGLSYLKKLFEGEDVEEKTLRHACEKLVGHSYAFHKELFSTAASYAIERQSRVINNDDVENGLNDLIKHIDGVVMKSVKSTYGFTQNHK